MFGIKRLREQLEELQKEVRRLNDNQTYYSYRVDWTSYAPPPCNYPLDIYASSQPMWPGYNGAQLPSAKSLKDQDVLDRFEELYSALSLERKTIPGTETTVKLEKKK